MNTCKYSVIFYAFNHLKYRIIRRSVKTITQNYAGIIRNANLHTVGTYNGPKFCLSII
jgi:hypothetical protein